MSVLTYYEQVKYPLDKRHQAPVLSSGLCVWDGNGMMIAHVNWSDGCNEAH